MRSPWSRSGSSSMGDTVKEGRFALGGVAHKPWRDPRAEAALHGQPATAATFARAADVLLREAGGYEHNTFKIDRARAAASCARAMAVLRLFSWTTGTAACRALLV
jgi:CO/xanthine dehydrogenase FAD-binding subunit